MGKKQKHVSEDCLQGKTIKLLKRMNPKSSGMPAAMQGPGYDIRQLCNCCKEKECQKRVMKLKLEELQPLGAD